MLVSLSHLHMFPLRTSQYRHPLPHVIGATVSEYYEMICLPSTRQTFFLRLIRLTSPHEEFEGSPKFLTLLSLHATRFDPGSPSGISPLAIPLYWLPAR